MRKADDYKTMSKYLIAQSMDFELSIPQRLTLSILFTGLLSLWLRPKPYEAMNQELKGIYIYITNPCMNIQTTTICKCFV